MILQERYRGSCAVKMLVVTTAHWLRSEDYDVVVVSG